MAQQRAGLLPRLLVVLFCLVTALAPVVPAAAEGLLSDHRAAEAQDGGHDHVAPEATDAAHCHPTIDCQVQVWFIEPAGPARVRPHSHARRTFHHLRLSAAIPVSDPPVPRVLS
ncbi:hypothetical protein GQE99_12175 [Maritimibacter sp. DP07]|uniref:Uncharacterized protein n=1 Tax=Maritimibacter harenae TaxID=2606218 RepID=A0A845M0D6_9RHOB|nr:hypothetical protein [Maritimibacter harenae]MZR13770.1 hypothetical protein [Maritimibacter harenae]